MRIVSVVALLLAYATVMGQSDIRLRKNDRKKDVILVTDSGTITLRLSDSTPLHRDHFLSLVKQGYYDSILFHRVINSFMIQGGDPDSKRAKPGEKLGNGGPSYTIPAEFRTTLFHCKGVLAAARQGDLANPQKASSGSQFYIVQGKKFTPAGLDSVETYRLKGRKIPAEQRVVYQTLGGSPHLDQQYTIFGKVVMGLEVVDKIAGTRTDPENRPLTDIRIKKAKLVKKKRTAQ
jgi:cyclophilin family peptidyl-prolyl cis-trans isomerase